MPAPPFGEAAALTTELTWLEVVAIHEAYRLSGIERRELHLETSPSKATGTPSLPAA